MNMNGKNRRSASLSLSQLRLIRKKQEEEALQAYGKALKDQDRSITRLEDVSQDLEEAQARLQHRKLAGASHAELSQIQDFCETLRQTQREWKQSARRSRNQTRLAFAELIKARHAAAVLNRQSATPAATSSWPQNSSLPHSSGAFNPVSLASMQGPGLHWN